MTFTEYSLAVRDYLLTQTDFFSLIDEVEKTWDMEANSLLVAASVLIEKAYNLGTEPSFAADAIYTGFVSASLNVIGNFKLDKNKIN